MGMGIDKDIGGREGLYSALQFRYEPQDHMFCQMPTKPHHHYTEALLGRAAMPYDRLHDLAEALEVARYAGLHPQMPSHPTPRQHRYPDPPSGTVRDRLHLQVSVCEMVDDKSTLLLRGHLHVLVSQSCQGFGARTIGQWTHH